MFGLIKLVLNVFFAPVMAVLAAIMGVLLIVVVFISCIISGPSAASKKLNIASWTME